MIRNDMMAKPTKAPPPASSGRALDGFRHYVQPFITDTRISIFESNGARAARSDANCQMNNANYETNPRSILFSTDDVNGEDGNPILN